MMTRSMYNKYLKPFMLALLLMAVVPVAFSGNRPKVGLALGGGGAKGAATIGVLKAIEEAGIKVDFIAGTSIGAIIGGLYASGVSLSTIEELFYSQEFRTILNGRGMENQFEELLTEYGCKQFPDTRIPFRCVAADYDELEEIVFSSGSLSKAMRASMSIPVVYKPVEWNGRRLVDGGLVNNLPVDVVRNMGADIVIAVDLQQGEESEFDIPMRKLLGEGPLSRWLHKRPDVKRHRMNKELADIYIQPDLRGFGVASFDRYYCEEMTDRGYEEAKGMWSQLVQIRKQQTN